MSLRKVIQLLGPEGWRTAEKFCRDVAACYKNSHYLAVDLMVGSDFRRFAVAEVNAFGDLLPGVMVDSDDTYTAEQTAC